MLIYKNALKERQSHRGVELKNEKLHPIKLIARRVCVKDIHTDKQRERQAERGDGFFKILYICDIHKRWERRSK